jgi:DNA-binding Xre family transcriptional regulator
LNKFGKMTIEEESTAGTKIAADKGIAEETTSVLEETKEDRVSIGVRCNKLLSRTIEPSHS